MLQIIQWQAYEAFQYGGGELASGANFNTDTENE